MKHADEATNYLTEIMISYFCITFLIGLYVLFSFSLVVYINMACRTIDLNGGILIQYEYYFVFYRYSCLRINNLYSSYSSGNSFRINGIPFLY